MNQDAGRYLGEIEPGPGRHPPDGHRPGWPSAGRNLGRGSGDIRRGDIRRRDLFDWMDVIGKLRDDEGLTQAKIGERIGWGREAVKRHIAVIDNMVPTILDFAEGHQAGRAPVDVPTGTIDFTERLFRDILSLTTDQQMDLVKKLVRGKDGKGHKYDKAETLPTMNQDRMAMNQDDRPQEERAMTTEPLNFDIDLSEFDFDINLSGIPTIDLSEFGFDIDLTRISGDTKKGRKDNGSPSDRGRRR